MKKESNFARLMNIFKLKGEFYFIIQISIHCHQEKPVDIEILK